MSHDNDQGYGKYELVIKNGEVVAGLKSEFRGKNFRGNLYESDFYQFVDTYNFKSFNRAKLRESGKVPRNLFLDIYKPSLIWAKILYHDFEF